MPDLVTIALLAIYIVSICLFLTEYWRTVNGYDNLMLIGYLGITTLVVYSMIRLLCSGKVNGLIPFIGLVTVLWITNSVIKRFNRRAEINTISENDVREQIEDNSARAKVSKTGVLVIKTEVEVGPEINMFIGERFYNRGLIKFNSIVKEVSIDAKGNQLVRR